MKTLITTMFVLFAMQTLYAGKDFCATLKNATEIISKKDLKALGEQISNDSNFGTEYKFPVSLYGARYAFAQASNNNILVKQYFENATKEKIQPIFINL